MLKHKHFTTHETKLIINQIRNPKQCRLRRVISNRYFYNHTDGYKPRLTQAVTLSMRKLTRNPLQNES